MHPGYVHVPGCMFSDHRRKNCNAIKEKDRERRKESA